MHSLGDVNDKATHRRRRVEHRVRKHTTAYYTHNEHLERHAPRPPPCAGTRRASKGHEGPGETRYTRAVVEK